jgi:hypothetical protein
MTTAAVVQVIAIAMALVLALRALRARNLPAASVIRWGSVWLAIIAALALFVDYSGLTRVIHLH